jgi:DNA-binding MarR family transcriptional regulator
VLRWAAHSVGKTSTSLLQRLHADGITVAQMMAMHTLHLEGAATMSFLARRLQLSLSATSSLVQKLVDGGLVTRKEHDTDRRNKVVALSPAGRAHVATLHRLRATDIQAAIKPLTKDTQDLLREALLAVLREVGPETNSFPPGAPSGNSSIKKTRKSS